MSYTYTNMLNIPSNEKYVIFLKPNYFKKKFFKSTYKQLIKNLELKGITVFNIEKTIDELKRMYKYKTSKTNNKIMFDDCMYPNTNTLYIHLFNSTYYNDTIYSKKKIEIEREMLFLLAGKLGVQYISYNTDIKETTIVKAHAGMNVKKLDMSIDFNKTITHLKGTTGKEEYLNRGAPVYLKSNNLQEVEENIKERIGKMNSNVFNYDFYKQSTKLESFVYKRFEFKMLKLEYTIDMDDISDISFSTKAAFMDVGLKLLFDKNISYNEKITYTLEFFSDLELKKEFGKIKRDYLDPFYSIRELYDLMNDKDKAVHLICEYTIELANKCQYTLESDTCIYNFSNKLSEFIMNSPSGHFETICHDFQSTSQIKNWIFKNLGNNLMEMNVKPLNNNNITETDKINTHVRNESVSIYSVPNKSEDKFINRPLNIVEEDFTNRLCTVKCDTPTLSFGQCQAGGLILALHGTAINDIPIQLDGSSLELELPITPTRIIESIESSLDNLDNLENINNSLESVFIDSQKPISPTLSIDSCVIRQIDDNIKELTNDL
jgi:hypothetical protein